MACEDHVDSKKRRHSKNWSIGNKNIERHARSIFYVSYYGVKSRGASQRWSRCRMVSITDCYVLGAHVASLLPPYTILFKPDIVR